MLKNYLILLETRHKSSKLDVEMVPELQKFRVPSLLDLREQMNKWS